MTTRLLVLGLACTSSLCAQRQHINWQDACFKNPALPYCPGHDFAVKRTKPGARGKDQKGGAWTPASGTIDEGGIDWRFADPSADSLAVLNCSELGNSPIAHSLIDRLGTQQGLREADLPNIFRALSAVGQIAVSIRAGRIVLFVTGRAPDSILPASEAEWKATSVGDALLVGHADAVDQAARRLSMSGPLGDLAIMALERQPDMEVWTAGTASLAGQDAVTAGVKRFSLTASLRDKVTTGTTYEFDAAPDTVKMQAWLESLVESKVDGNIVYAKLLAPTEDAGQSCGKIAASPLAQPLGSLIKSARYLPVRDTATTRHTRPVIYGLDEGAKEVK